MTAPVPSTDAARAGGTVPETMHALVKTRPAPGADYLEVPVPRPGPGELLIRVEAASLCGTDLHIERLGRLGAGRLGGLPRIFGHEMAGRVVAHGEGLLGRRRSRMGTLVAAETHLVGRDAATSAAPAARTSARNLRILGVDIDGAFAEYVVLPARNAWPSPRASTPEIAATPGADGQRRPRRVRGGDRRADRGRARLRAHRADGRRRSPTSPARAPVFATDINPERLEMARQMGADVDARRRASDVVGRLREATDGNGVDVVLEMSGAEPALHQGLAAVTNGGRVSLLGTARRGRSRSTSATRSSSRASASTASPAAGCSRPGTGPRRCSRRASTSSPIMTHRLPLAGSPRRSSSLAAGHAGKVVLLPQEALTTR